MEIFVAQKKQAAHYVMALPNVIWPWSIFYSKDQLLRKENEESLGVFYFLKLNIQNQLIVWETCAKPAKVLQYMECLNFNVWIWKVENWNLKFEMFGIWNFEN
jgi:hypothetical protein